MSLEHTEVLTYRIEQQLRLLIQPKPKWWPRWLWHWVLKKVVVLEMHPPSFRGE